MDLRVLRRPRLLWKRCFPDLCQGLTPQKAVRKITLRILFYRFFQFLRMLSAGEKCTYLSTFGS